MSQLGSSLVHFDFWRGTFEYHVSCFKIDGRVPPMSQRPWSSTIILMERIGVDTCPTYGIPSCVTMAPDDGGSQNSNNDQINCLSPSRSSLHRSPRYRWRPGLYPAHTEIKALEHPYGILPLPPIPIAIPLLHVHYKNVSEADLALILVALIASRTCISFGGRLTWRVGDYRCLPLPCANWPSHARSLSLSHSTRSSILYRQSVDGHSSPLQLPLVRKSHTRFVIFACCFSFV